MRLGFRVRDVPHAPAGARAHQVAARALGAVGAHGAGVVDPIVAWLADARLVSG